MNFKEETYFAIAESGHTREDVLFIGSSNGKYRMDMDTFDTEGDFYYDDGFGLDVIPHDLIIYFKDQSYITRWEHGGSEGWAYHRPKIFTDEDDYQKVTLQKDLEQSSEWAYVHEVEYKV